MKYDFRLSLNKMDTNGIFIYNQEVVKTPNEAINCTVNEKIRRFNNSVIYLMNYLENLVQTNVCGKMLVDYCKDIPTNEDESFRFIIRSICLEMFILREKIHNILCNIFFVEQKDNFLRDVIPVLQKIATKIPELSLVLSCLKEIGKSEECIFITKIRNDEIHNMSIIDSFNWSPEKTPSGLEVKNNGYRISAKKFFDKTISVADKYLKLIALIQDVLNISIYKIYKIRESMDIEIFINMNESFE